MAVTNDGNIPRSHLLELIECSICTETFTDPRVLPCQHTFCLQCLESTAYGTRPGGSMLCPLCRRQFTIAPREGIAGLTRDFKVQALIDLYNSDPPNITETKDSCRLHPTKSLDVFCFDCEKMTCGLCRQRSHSQHKTSAFNQVADDLRRRIAEEIARLETWSEEVSAKRAQITCSLAKFVSDVESAEQDIIKYSNDLFQRIEKHRLSLLVELGTMKQTRLEEIGKALKESDDHLAILESLKSFYGSIRCNGSPTEICEAANALPVKMTTLREQQTVQTERQVPLGNICFWESDLDEFRKAKNVVGELQVANLVNLDRSTSFTMPSSVSGVATIDGNIFVLCRDPKSLRIYSDESPYVLEKQLSISEIRDPWDMAASPPSNCLYITDQFSECVWKLSAPMDVERSGWLSRVVGNRMTRWWTGKESHTIRWLTGISYPYTISVSRDGLRVLMVRQGQPCYVESYRPDGVRIQRLMLAPDVESVRHAVETAKGNLVVSHKWKTNGKWSVCEVNRDGQILHRFCAKNARQQALDEPLHVAVDSDERVFVADYRNNRVIQFDSQLNWIRIALSKDCDVIQEPSRLCCDQGKKRLLIGQTEGNLGLYSISCK